MVKLGRSPVLDIGTLGRMFRDEYPINQEAFKRNKTRLLVGLTSARTGEEVMVDAGKLKNPLSPVIATMLVPFISGLPSPTVKINGEGYYDGGIPNPLPMNRALEQDPTHILVLAPVPLDFRIQQSPMVENTIHWMVTRGLLPKIGHALADFPRNFNTGYDELQACVNGNAEINGVKIAVIAPTNFIDPLSMKKSELYERQQNAKLFTSQLLQQV